MINQINSYEELLREQQRLKALLQTQKQIIRQDINEIKEELAPVKSVISFVGKLTTKGSGNPLLSGAAGTIIDLVIRKLVLARAGWITKLVVPFLVKNYSSHIIDDNEKSIFKTLLSWLPKRKKKPKDNLQPAPAPIK
jgi:hypothetical protein